jgi:predicted DCC family thiol-disulfide oxidoreductase YuxK
MLPSMTVSAPLPLSRATGVPPPATILFDGVCVLCSRWYQFVSARAQPGQFRFVAIQEPEGRELAVRHGVNPDNPATFIFVDAGCAYMRSDAMLRIVGALPGWRWIRAFRLVPAGIRDGIYNMIARNRYQWFGRLDVCILQSRFPTSAE